MPSKAASGIQRLGALLRDVGTLAGWSVKGALAAPLADVMLELGPPWPPQSPVVTSILELAVLVLVLSLASNVSARRRKQLLVGFSLIAALALLTYLVLASQLIVPAPDGRRLVSGLTIRADVVALLGSGYSPLDVLRDAAWNPEEVWTRSSITAARLLLFSAWCTTFGAFVAFLGVFALRRPKPRRG
jgi:asparagine N-glycosylation enzyme membrane subunit Stt3